jgi:hypothetical protein
MKKNELKNLLKDIIQEEVKKEVTEQMNKFMGGLLAEIINNNRNNNQSILTESKKTENSSPPAVAVLDTDIQRKNMEKDISNKVYSKDPKINSILKETAIKALNNNSDRMEESYHSPLVGLDEEFSKIGDNDEKVYSTSIPQAVSKLPKEIDVSSRMNMLKSIVSTSPSSVSTSVVDIPGAVPTPLKNIFNRDFRKTMKIIDEKKKSGVDTSLFMPPTSFNQEG